MVSLQRFRYCMGTADPLPLVAETLAFAHRFSQSSPPRTRLSRQLTDTNRVLAHTVECAIHLILYIRKVYPQSEQAAHSLDLRPLHRRNSVRGQAFPSACRSATSRAASRHPPPATANHSARSPRPPLNPPKDLFRDTQLFDIRLHECRHPRLTDYIRKIVDSAMDQLKVVSPPQRPRRLACLEQLG